MTDDIFKFWSRIERGQKIHPADKEVFSRISPEKHGFMTNCLPGCYAGKLRSAPVVLLYLSPGFSEQDLKDAKSEKAKDYYFKCWAGDEPLPQRGDAAEAWLKSRTRLFGSYENIRQKVAILNIGAYHSKNVADYASLMALPSSRASLDWAQNVLFPDAEAGKRLVVCMRSASYWGLERGKTYAKGLYVPDVTRAGHLIKNDINQMLIDKISRAVG